MAAARKFACVPKEVDLKHLYSHETNFKGRVGDTDHIYRILPLPPRGGNELRRRNFPNSVFVTMFLPLIASDTTVKRTFLEFGEVHNVFAGKFKKPYNDISNGKRCIRITSYKTKPMEYSLMTLGFFRSCAERRKYHAKNVSAHKLRDTYHPAPGNLANEDSPPDNEDIVLASMKNRG